MPVPPDEVPDGLSTEEYARLTAIYTLMGRGAQAREAGRRAMSEEEQQELAEIENDRQYLAGQAVGRIFSKLVLQANVEEGSLDAALEQAKSELVAEGLSEEEAVKGLNALSGFLTRSQEVPSSDVPEGLTAELYYHLAVRYKSIGWTEQARDALHLAIEQDPDGVYGRKALTYLRSKIPKFPVPMMAVEGNIRGYNQMVSQQIDEALKTFRQLIEDYPDFEWPLGNLGSLLLYLGDTESAKATLLRAVEINPHYLNGWLHLARTHAVEGNLEEAYKCVNRAEEIDGGESLVATIRQMIDALKAKS